MVEVEGAGSSAPVLLLGWLSSFDSVSIGPASTAAAASAPC